MTDHEYQNTALIHWRALSFLQADKLWKWAHTPRSCPLFNISHKNIDFATFRVGWRGTGTFSNVNPLLIGWWEMRNCGRSVDNMTKPQLRGSLVKKPSSRQWQRPEKNLCHQLIQGQREPERDGGKWVEVIKDTSAFWLQPIPSRVLSNDVCVGASNPPRAN